MEAARLLRETEQARLRALVSADMDAAGPGSSSARPPNRMPGLP
ncbi:MAG TPA: hypothetical protein VGQ05_21950 [Streptosporangiaceae bacterium]|nr:hypothetical protein [Streptosporangiaceae bacterium]